MIRLLRVCFLTALFILTTCGSGRAATFMVTNTLDSGAGSLRRAMDDANANVGPDQISFNIPPSGPKTITIVNFLPNITDPVVIDGTTQPGFGGTPIIELTGATPNSSGFFCIASNNTIRGFVINNLSWAIYFYGGSSSNRVEGNWMGLSSDGTT